MGYILLCKVYKTGEAMKYNYSKNGYHPGQVSFEVSAILMDEENSRLEGASILRDTIIGSNYEYGGYSREIERAFNPLTDQKTTFKYTQYKRKHKVMRDYLDKINKEEKEFKKRIGLLRSFIHRSAKIFDNVIQDMLVKHVMLHSVGKEELVSHVNFLNVAQVNKLSSDQALLNAKYVVHPHVDALLNERAHQERGRYR